MTKKTTKKQPAKKSQKDAVDSADAKTAKKTTKKSSKTPSKSKSKTTSSKKTKQAEPNTMAQLLQQEGVELRNLKRGDVIEGTITDIGAKSVYLDIGAKTEGLVNDKEYQLAESYIQTLEIGDKVDAYVLTPENESGQIILSLRQAASNYVWGQLEEWLSSGEVLTVKIRETNRGGAIVSVIDQLDGFIPSSQFTSELQNQISSLVNQSVETKIIDLNRDESKIILSEKAVSEAEDIARKREALEQLESGKEYQGQVTRVVPFGIFVQLDTPKSDSDEYAPEGLVHISELSWEKISDPSELYKVGDSAKVQVLEVQPKVGKLSLSIKRLKPDPWEDIEKKYPVDTQISGEVTEVLPFGIFVRLEPGISGLIHASKLLGQTYKSGDKVNCYVESIDKAHRRLSLGLVLTAKPVGYK